MAFQSDATRRPDALREMGQVGHSVADAMKRCLRVPDSTTGATKALREAPWGEAKVRK